MRAELGADQAHRVYRVQRARVVGPNDRLEAAQRRGDEGLRAVEVAALLQDQPEIVLGRRLSSRQPGSHTSQPRRRG